MIENYQISCGAYGVATVNTGLSNTLKGVPLEKIQACLKLLPQVECPVENFFSEGVYARQIFMPAGTFVIGKKHKTAHLNILLSGRVSLMMNEEIIEIEAPYVLHSGVGVKKVLYIFEDAKWLTIHPTGETDLDVLEELIIEPEEEYHLTEKEKEMMMEIKGGVKCLGEW